MTLDPLLRFWRAQDDLFGSVEPAWWGAVVSDPRFPRVQEPNYARVETRQPVHLEEVERLLLPAMARSGSSRSHVVIFHPEEQTDLVVEASTRGVRISWDLVMQHPGGGSDGGLGGSRSERGGASVAPDGTGLGVVEVREPDESFWSHHRASMEWFDVTEPDVIDQLQAIEREVLIPAGRRWFGVAGSEGLDALAALLVLEGVAYLDHVVTFPRARRRGHAGALTRRAVAEATAAGAERTYLLAEPDGVAAAMYERIGFTRAGQLASWLSDRTG